MKIKQNQTVNETNINQMSTQTPVKTGDTTFVDGLKDLDMANSMKETLDTKEVAKNSVENKSETLEDDASKKINDFCQSNINYVSKNETDKKETMPKMIMEEVVPEEAKHTTPKASMEEFEYFEKSNNQFLALEQTIQTISELPKNNKNELKSEIKDNNKLQEHEEVQLSVEDFKPEEVKEQLKPQIDSLNSMKDISTLEDEEISKNFNTMNKKHDLKSETNKNNNMLDKILNDDVDLVGKIPVMEEVVPKELRQPENNFDNKIGKENKAEIKSVNEVENVLNKDFDNKAQKNLEKTFEPKQNINSKSEMKFDSKLEVKQQVEPEVEQKTAIEQKAENSVFEQKQSATPKSTQDLELKSTTIGRTAVEPEKKQPLEDLNKFLTEIMSEDTVEDLKSKDVSMIDDNTLLTEEIKNYYNLNKAQNLAATEDVKNVINERIAEIDDLASIVETAQEAKSVQKELKSLDVQKVQPKKVETKQLKMTEQDANFFIELVKNNQETGQTATDTATQILQDLQQADEAQQTTRVSKALADMIGEAAKTNKPFRIDFDKNISVIIKIDREGKISAEFLPGDKAVEQFLRTQLPMLRQKFNDENIDYKDLNYRQSNGGRQNRERRRRGE